MEKLFSIILLTLINVLEILLLLNTTLLQFELVVILFLLLIVFLMLFMMDEKYFWGMALLVFIINTINIGYLFIVFGGGYLLYMATTLVILGIVFSLLNLAKIPEERPRVRYRPIVIPKPKYVKIEEEISLAEEKPRIIIEEYPVVEPAKEETEERVVKERPKKIAKKNVKKKAVKKVAKKKPAAVKEVKKVYKPGKYVASALAKVYHVPKCEWANNIKKKNRIWFNSREKAEKLGYVKHDCVENNKSEKAKN